MNRFSRERTLLTEGIVMKVYATHARTKAAVFLEWLHLTSRLVSIANKFTLCRLGMEKIILIKCALDVIESLVQTEIGQNIEVTTSPGPPPPPPPK